MAFVIKKPGGRFEVRETRRTPAGPRATTLATFGTFSDEVVRQATARAEQPVDAARLRTSARRAGAPIETARADHLTRQLLCAIAEGQPPAPGLRRALFDALTRSDLPDGQGGDLDRWIGVDDAARGAVLEDLLGLADALPARRRSALTFPKLSSGPRV